MRWEASSLGIRCAQHCEFQFKFQQIKQATLFCDTVYMYEIVIGNDVHLTLCCLLCCVACCQAGSVECVASKTHQYRYCKLSAVTMCILVDCWLLMIMVLSF